MKRVVKQKTNNGCLLITTFILAIILFKSDVLGAITVTVAQDGSGDYNCDGINDEAEINQALEYIKNVGGGTVLIKSGTYNINNPIIITAADTVLQGEGITSILKLVDYANNPPWDQITPILNIKNNRVTLQNLKIDGNFDRQNLPGGYNYLDLVHVSGNDVVIKNNYFYDGKCDAIDCSGALNLLVTENYFCNIDHEAVTGSYSNSLIENNQVYLNTNTHGTNAAFRLYLGDNNIWRKNTISSKQGITQRISMGFEIHSYNNNSNCFGIIENNTMSDQYTNAIVFDRGSSSQTTDKNKCRGYIIRNNIINKTVFYNNDYSNGIKIWDTYWNNFTIENNVIYGVAGDGIWIGDNISDISLKNNIIVKNKKSGIKVGNTLNITSSYNDVADNLLGNYQGISPGIGDIALDPLFSEAVNGDFHLQSQYGRWNGNTWVTDPLTSPCIGAGAPASDNSKSPWRGTIEMGAYGNTPESSKNQTNVMTTPDINQDGAVDISDLRIAALHFGETTTNPYPRYDVDANGTVDILDIRQVAGGM